jgi:LDH2 family malate/lactate/ureidoglycolate dehydrogenase
MPRIVTAHELTEILTRIYLDHGVSEEDTATVVRYQVDSNLCGHDSHGVLRTPIYTKLIREGRVVPDAPFEVVEDHPASMVVDGHRNLGFVVTERAQDLLFEKARSLGVAAMSIRNQSHVGRLGAYTERAAERGFAALMVADSGRGPKSVAPFGGTDRRLGTNPISVALPASLDGPILMDMATSAVAGGKIKVVRSKGEPMGKGWAIDKDGNATTDPEDFYGGGALLPLGADQGHKGYSLSFVVESLAAVLAGIGYGEDAEGFPNDGILMVLFNIAMFRPLRGFMDEMAEFARYVKASPPAPGFEEVLYPGEFEARHRAQRSAEGIEVPDRVWNDLQDLLSSP